MIAAALVGFIGLAAAASGREMVVAYVPNWIDLAAFARTIDYEKLTLIDVAFENPVNDAGDLSFEKKDAALIDSAHAHGVKVLVSIGGGAASDDRILKRRYAELLSEEKRAVFVEKIAAYLKEHGFDGLDVDIEGPSIGANYGPFIETLAAALKPRGLLLTAALSRGYGGDRVPDSVFAQLDFVNIMAYDATGPWEPKAPGQHSSLMSARENVAYWIGRGLPREKAVLGLPFYGYGFGKAFRKRDYPFAEIVEKFPGAESRDESGETVFYNGIPTIQEKVRLAAAEQLAGVMIWSLDADAKGAKSLLSAIHAATGK